MNLGRAIREVIRARVASQRRQSDVAMALGVSENYLSLLLNNKRGIKLGTLEALAKVLNVPPSFFYILADDTRDGLVLAFQDQIRAKIAESPLNKLPVHRRISQSQDTKEEP